MPHVVTVAANETVPVTAGGTRAGLVMIWESRAGTKYLDLK